MKISRLSCVIAGFVSLVLIAVAAPAWADEFDNAFNAYSAGNFADARPVLKGLAQGGDVRAQYLMGRMFSEGEGVSKDEAEAIKWYNQAAYSGDIVSQLALGTMYVNGRGVGRDFIQAYGWFTVVSEYGSRDMVSQALEVRDLIEQLMSTPEIKEAEAFAAAWKPL